MHMILKNNPVHDLSKKQIYRKALFLRSQYRLYNLQNPQLDDLFKGSIDRFVIIASKLRYAKRVLDVGAGHSVLSSLLSELGHECYALDIFDSTAKYSYVYQQKPIQFKICNVEVDPIPFTHDFFDTVVCCQVLEHFTHSHLYAMNEINRVLKQGGIIEIDVPNAVCFRNRSRMIRGKHITYDYEKHYLYSTPVFYKGLSFYPERHNREFTAKELKTLLEAANFKGIEVVFLKSRRHRVGLERIRDIGSAARDLIPSFRKSLIAFAQKETN